MTDMLLALQLALTLAMVTGIHFIEAYLLNPVSVLLLGSCWKPPVGGDYCVVEDRLYIRGSDDQQIHIGCTSDIC